MDKLESPYHTTILGLTTGVFHYLDLAQKPHYTINPRLDQEDFQSFRAHISTIQNTILQIIVHNHTLDMLDEELVFPLTIKTCFNLLPTLVISYNSEGIVIVI